MKYQEWIDQSTTQTYQACHWDVFTVCRGSLDFKESELQGKIQRIEDYPTCMSCYATVEEMQAATAMKETILKILKEEK